MAKIPKKSAAFFLEVSVPTITKYMKEGLLPTPLTKEAVYSLKERLKNPKFCMACGHNWNAKSDRSRCPKCRSTKTSDEHIDTESTLTTKTAAGLLNVSPSTIMNWVKKGRLTNVGTETRILLKRLEVTYLLNASRNYICYTCKHEWRRKKDYAPVRCSRCGGKRLAVVERTFPEMDV